MKEEERGAIKHASIIIKEGLDREDDIQEILKKLLNLIQTQQNDIQRMQELLDLSDANNVKKDKIINEMLEEYEYNVRINVKNFCDEEMRRNTCIQDCKNCIKQYFEREVNNVK